MKNSKTYLILFMAIALFSGLASAEPVAVIVNTANKQIVSKEDVKNIYDDRIITWANGEKITVYNLPVASIARETFAQKVLGMSAQEAATAESNRLITNTQRNPQRLKRERLVVSIVSKNPHAIGYASEESIAGKEGIRVLFVIE